PVTDDELRKAVNQIEADFTYSRESVSAEGSQIGYYDAIKDWRYLTTYLDHVRKVTKADIQRAANQYFTADNRTVGWFVPVEGSGPGGMEGPPKEAGARVERAPRGARPIPLPKTTPPAEQKRRMT